MPEVVKVVINTCFGGFGVSDYVKDKWEKETGKVFYSWEVPRTDKVLIDIIERIGVEKAGGHYSQLSIEEIDQDAIDSNAWEISEYDGNEHIRINHEAIELYRKKKEEQLLRDNISEFLKFTLNVINDDSTDEEKIRAIKDVMTIHNTDDPDPFKILKDAVDNIRFVPKYGSKYKEAENDFNDLAI